jgi:hypothetical protein
VLESFAGTLALGDLEPEPLAALRVGDGDRDAAVVRIPEQATSIPSVVRVSSSRIVWRAWGVVSAATVSSTGPREHP